MTRYAIADLHGHYKLYEEVKRRLRPSDVLYVLGDCADRGPDGWKTLRAVIEDPQCFLIMGNHEVMLRDTMKSWLKILEKKIEEPEDCDSTPIEMADEDIKFTRSFELLALNGGVHTFWDWRKEDEFMDWYDRICNLPLEAQIYDTKVPLILTHAGYTPGRKPDNEDDLVWDRNHFFHRWPEDYEAIIIHGHSPQQYLYEELIEFSEFFGRINGSPYVYDKDSFEVLGYDKTGAEIFEMVYCGGHKIDIDPGTILSKRGILLNLETLEQEMIVFQEDEWRKK